MKKIKKEYFSLTVQRRTGGGKLARPIIPIAEIKKAEEALNISIEQGLKYKCVWVNALQSWVITPQRVKRQFLQDNS